MRLDFQQQAETAHRDRLIAHDDGKGFSNYLKGLQRQAGNQGSDGDDLKADLSATGAIR